jgi:hypothetical protein
MQIVNAADIDLRERAREKVGLLLVVPFEAYTIARRNRGFEEARDFVRLDALSGATAQRIAYSRKAPL